MINITEIFNNNDITRSVGLWLGDDGDSTDLAGAAEYAVEMKVPALSVSPKDVGVVWPWVEKLNVKIIPRFYIDSVVGDNVSDLAINVKSVFKHGADGAQMIMRLSELNRFVDSLLPVRDDLFFQKSLSVGLDIFEVWPLDWDDVFKSLEKLKASSLLLILTHDDGDKSDFTGRIYGALQSWNSDLNMELHVMLGESWGRAEQVYRLIAKMRPELLNRLKFFISY